MRQVLFVAAVANLLIMVAAHVGGAAEPRPSSVRPLPKDATLENAFAALGADTIPDGRLVAPFYDYVVGPHALATPDAVYCAFQNRVGQPQVMVYRPAAKSWDGPVTASTFGLKADDHGNPAIVLDRRGYLHVFYGCHGGPMRQPIAPGVGCCVFLFHDQTGYAVRPGDPARVD